MTIRILTQLNFSAGENPQGDSGIRFTSRLIREIQATSDRYFFYVLAPEGACSVLRDYLDCDRVLIIPMQMPSRLHGGDFAFDPTALYKNFDFRRFDVDLLFLNQPEMVAPYSNFLNRQMFHLVPTLTYVHWFDTRRPATPKHRTHHPALLASLAGMVGSTTVACNSEYGRSIIMACARNWLSADLANALDQKLKILPPLFSAGAVRAGRRQVQRSEAIRPRAMLLVNHRVLKYTGVRQLIDVALPRLWEQRQDFRVIITNPSRARLPREMTRTPWAINGTLGEKDYFARLWDADIVLAPHRAAHWSISTLEAVASGCLPICNKESFFGEMFAPVLARLTRAERAIFEDYCLFFRGNLIGKIGRAIDDLEKLAEFRHKLGRHTRAVYDWPLRIGEWIETIEAIYKTVPQMPETNPTMQRILAQLESRGELTKAELLRWLGWSPKDRTLSWTAFRKTLRGHVADDPESAELRLRWR
jgi:glycosyltransferase involved in cell wall biosynthesis